MYLRNKRPYLILILGALWLTGCASRTPQTQADSASSSSEVAQQTETSTVPPPETPPSELTPQFDSPPSISEIALRLELQCEPCDSVQYQQIMFQAKSSLSKLGYGVRLGKNFEKGEAALRLFGLKEKETWYLSYVILGPQGNTLEFSRDSFQQGFPQLLQALPELARYTQKRLQK